MIKIGAAGYGGSKEWDDKGKSEVSEIYISHVETIQGLQFQYMYNGKLVLSDLHGFLGQPHFDTVRLNLPSEYITWIGGCYSTEKQAITSLEFGTSKGTYGPFGNLCNSKLDQSFKFHLGHDKQFGRFYCTCGEYQLNSIGVYLKPYNTMVPNSAAAAAEEDDSEDDDGGCWEIQRKKKWRRLSATSEEEEMEDDADA